jgi:hypothetical protein
MRVALCFSGQPRNIESGYKFFNPNLLEGNKPDVFVHTWFSSEQVGKPFVNSGGHVASSPVAENTIDIVNQLYSPKGIEYEPQRQFDEKDYGDRKYPAIRPFNSLSKMYSMWRVQEICKAFGPYDIVFHARFDLAIHQELLLSQYDTNVVNTPNSCPHPNSIDYAFAWSNQEHMDNYAKLFWFVDDYYRKDGITFCDELLIRHHLLSLNIPVMAHNIPYSLLRG